MAFLTIGGIEIPVPVTGTAEQDTAAQGKRRWRFTSAPLDTADRDALVALIGVQSGAESERAWDGSLLTDRPFVAVTGDAVGGGPVSCEVSITGTSYRPHRDPVDGACFRVVVALTLREA